MLQFDSSGLKVEYEDFGDLHLFVPEVQASELYQSKAYLKVATDLLERKPYFALGYYLLNMHRSVLQELNFDLQNYDDAPEETKHAVTLTTLMLLQAEGHTVLSAESELGSSLLQQALDSLKICTTITQGWLDKRIKGKVLFRHFSLIDSLSKNLVDNPGSLG